MYIDMTYRPQLNVCPGCGRCNRCGQPTPAPVYTLNPGWYQQPYPFPYGTTVTSDTSTLSVS